MHRTQLVDVVLANVVRGLSEVHIVDWHVHMRYTQPVQVIGDGHGPAEEVYHNDRELPGRNVLTMCEWHVVGVVRRVSGGREHLHRWGLETQISAIGSSSVSTLKSLDISNTSNQGTCAAPFANLSKSSSAGGRLCFFADLGHTIWIGAWHTLRLETVVSSAIVLARSPSERFMSIAEGPGGTGGVRSKSSSLDDAKETVWSAFLL